MYLRRNKYRNHRITVNDESFDSKKEFHRFVELRILEDAGVIRNLQRQVKYELIPAQREPETVNQRGRMIPGKVIERECCYVADFCYEQNGEVVVEDVKGYRGGKAYDVFKIKKKLMLYRYGIRVREI